MPVDGLNSLTDVAAQINEQYAPSRAIPARVLTKVNEVLYRLLDFFLFRHAVRAGFALGDLTDLESAPREALELFLLEFDLPAPNFATTAQLRAVVRDAGFISKFRSNPQGLERYLTDLSPEGVTVDVSIKRFEGRIFMLSVPGYGLNSYEDMRTAGSSVDVARYLFGQRMLEQTLSVRVEAEHGTLSSDFKRFVGEVVPYFIPMTVSDIRVEAAAL